MQSTAGMTAGTGMTDSDVTVMTGVATTNATSALMIDAVRMIGEALMNTVVRTIGEAWMNAVDRTIGEARMNAVVLMVVAIMTGGM
jgi:hypothetical protein